MFEITDTPNHRNTIRKNAQLLFKERCKYRMLLLWYVNERNILASHGLFFISRRKYIQIRNEFVLTCFVAYRTIKIFNGIYCHRWDEEEKTNDAPSLEMNERIDTMSQHRQKHNLLNWNDQALIHSHFAWQRKSVWSHFELFAGGFWCQSRCFFFLFSWLFSQFSRFSAEWMLILSGCSSCFVLSWILLRFIFLMTLIRSNIY